MLFHIISLQKKKKSDNIVAILNLSSLLYLLCSNRLFVWFQILVNWWNYIILPALTLHAGRQEFVLKLRLVNYTWARPFLISWQYFLKTRCHQSLVNEVRSSTVPVVVEFSEKPSTAMHWEETFKPSCVSQRDEERHDSLSISEQKSFLLSPTAFQNNIQNSHEIWIQICDTDHFTNQNMHYIQLTDTLHLHFQHNDIQHENCMIFLSKWLSVQYRPLPPTSNCRHILVPWPGDGFCDWLRRPTMPPAFPVNENIKKKRVRNFLTICGWLVISLWLKTVLYAGTNALVRILTK